MVGDGCTRAGGELEGVVGDCTRAGGAVNFVGGELGGDAAGVGAVGCGVGLAVGRVGDTAGIGGAELAGGCGGDAAGVGADKIGGEPVETFGTAPGEGAATRASLPSSQRATIRLPTA